MSLIENFRNIFKIEDLKNRILYTIGILMVYRVGSYITLPGVDASALIAGAGDASSLLGLFDLFVGGAFSRAGVFALGIMPYISASIIIQLLGSVLPYFQRLNKEGEEGRKKLNISDNMIRLSIGLEDVEDLIEDIDQALKQINI